MQIEVRPKHPGIKIHLDGEETAEILKYFETAKFVIASASAASLPHKHVAKLGKKIKTLMLEVPDLLKERTEEQVKKALLKDQAKIVEQLEALQQGEDWKHV